MILMRILATMSIGRHLMRLQLFQGISFMNHTLWWSDFERRIKGIQGAPWQASVILLCGYHSPARNCFICNAALCTNGASFDRRFNSINWWPVFINRFYLFRNAFCLKSYKSLLDFILPGFPEVEGKFWSNSIFQIFPWQLENRSRGESLLLWWK